MTGIIVLSGGQLDLRLDDGDHLGGLFCGQPVDVLIGGDWRKSRLEIDNAGDWYLAGLPDDIGLLGLRVRI